MRRLVLALLMLNILFALWMVLRPVPDASDVAGAQQFSEPLVLRGEIARPLRVVERQPAYCPALGPFASEDDVRAFADAHLTAQPWRIAIDEQALPPLYRVFVPPADAGPDGAALLVSVRGAIEASGLDIDSYLVVDGDLDGAVSLGLFAGRGNAQSVYGQIEGLDLAVEMRTENRSRNLYSIVLTSYEDSDFTHESVAALQALDAEAGITEKLCEMIALPD